MGPAEPAPAPPAAPPPPQQLQVTVTLTSYAATAAFRDWLASGDCAQAFWAWCGRHGRHF